MAKSDLFPTIMPSAMEGTTLGGATTATYPTKDADSGRSYVPFTHDDHEGVLIHLGQMPQRFNSGLVTKARFVVSIDDDDTGAPSVALCVQVEAITPDADNIDMQSATSFAAATTGAALVPGTAKDPFTIEVTLGMDSAAIGDDMRLVVYRDHDHVADTGVGNLWVHSMNIWQEPA